MNNPETQTKNQKNRRDTATQRQDHQTARKNTDPTGLYNGEIESQDL